MTSETTESTGRRFGTREAAFIGVGSMVGAGIFSLLGTAGEIAGSAVWISFVLAGIMAALQGYSFARLGARFPSAGGLIEYINQAFGRGHLATVMAWLGYSINIIVTAMVAVSFGSYASSAFANGDEAWVKIFGIALVVAMTVLNVAGSSFVARVQTADRLRRRSGSSTLFAVVTIANANFALLAPSTYPSVRHIISSVALTFFAFLGFGVVTFTARDLPDPSRQLPRAMGLAIGIATVIYVAVSIGVFGTLPVHEVDRLRGRRRSRSPRSRSSATPGFWLMSVTALFATTGATNAGPLSGAGVGDHLAGPASSRRSWASGSADGRRSAC